MEDEEGNRKRKKRRTTPNKLSKENKALLVAHYTAKNNALKDSTLRDNLNSYITKYTIIQFLLLIYIIKKILLKRYY